MSYSVDEKTNKITLTRGDTLITRIGIGRVNGDIYTPSESDTIRFALKSSYDDTTPLINKNISTSTMILRLDPTDTKSLKFGTYVYDVQLTTEDGIVDTFIKGKLKLTEEVD